MLRRLLERLYPPRDEITIFTMAVAFVALVFIAADFRNALSNGTLIVLVDLRETIFPSSFWEGIKVSAGFVVLVSVFMSSLALSLFLPFTTRNLDVFVSLTVLAHVILICISNFVAYDTHRDLTSGIFSVASLLYFFVLSVGLRFRLLTISTTNKQATSVQDRVAAISVVVLVAVSSVGFNLHWANCYAIAAAYAIGIAQLVK